MTYNVFGGSLNVTHL